MIEYELTVDQGVPLVPAAAKFPFDDLEAGHGCLTVRLKNGSVKQLASKVRNQLFSYNQKAENRNKRFMTRISVSTRESVILVFRIK